MPVTVHHRACHLCEAICGLRIETDGDHIVSIKGDPADPLSRGHIWPQGRCPAGHSQRPRPAAQSSAAHTRHRPVARNQLGGSAGYHSAAGWWRLLNGTAWMRWGSTWAIPRYTNYGMMTHQEEPVPPFPHPQPLLRHLRRPVATPPGQPLAVRPQVAVPDSRHRPERVFSHARRQPHRL